MAGYAWNFSDMGSSTSAATPDVINKVGVRDYFVVYNKNYSIEKGADFVDFYEESDESIEIHFSKAGTSVIKFEENDKAVYYHFEIKQRLLTLDKRYYTTNPAINTIASTEQISSSTENVSYGQNINLALDHFKYYKAINTINKNETSVSIIQIDSPTTFEFNYTVYYDRIYNITINHFSTDPGYTDDLIVAQKQSINFLDSPRSLLDPAILDGYKFSYAKERISGEVIDITNFDCSKYINLDIEINYYYAPTYTLSFKFYEVDENGSGETLLNYTKEPIKNISQGTLIMVDDYKDPIEKYQYYSSVPSDDFEIYEDTEIKYFLQPIQSQSFYNIYIKHLDLNTNELINGTAIETFQTTSTEYEIAAPKEFDNYIYNTTKVNNIIVEPPITIKIENYIENAIDITIIYYYQLQEDSYTVIHKYVDMDGINIEAQEPFTITSNTYEIPTPPSIENYEYNSFLINEQQTEYSIGSIITLSENTTTITYKYKLKEEGATSDEYFTYTLNDDGTYTIAAKNVNNLPSDIVLTASYKGVAVTWIGSSAFEGSSITSVTIPNGITTIHISAFKNCLKLKSIIMADSITVIGNGAFMNCTNLTSVYYFGTQEEWADIAISYGNEPINNATIYYYSEEKPTSEGNYWHYVNNIPTPWNETEYTYKITCNYYSDSNYLTLIKTQNYTVLGSNQEIEINPADYRITIDNYTYQISEPSSIFTITSDFTIKYYYKKNQITEDETPTTPPSSGTDTETSGWIYINGDKSKKFIPNTTISHILADDETSAWLQIGTIVPETLPNGTIYLKYSE